jgi:hypothetical protein
MNIKYIEWYRAYSFHKINTVNTYFSKLNFIIYYWSNEPKSGILTRNKDHYVEYQFAFYDSIYIVYIFATWLCESKYCALTSCIPMSPWILKS